MLDLTQKHQSQRKEKFQSLIHLHECHSGRTAWGLPWRRSLCHLSAHVCFDPENTLLCLVKPSSLSRTSDLIPDCSFNEDVQDVPKSFPVFLSPNLTNLSELHQIHPNNITFFFFTNFLQFVFTPIHSVPVMAAHYLCSRCSSLHPTPPLSFKICAQTFVSFIQRSLARSWAVPFKSR